MITKRYTWYFLLFVFLIVDIAGQNNASIINNTLIIGVGKTLNISGGDIKTLTLTIDRKVEQKQNLYITTQSPFNDPFQQPIITVKSDNAFQVVCEEQANDFIGICLVNNQDIVEGRVFNITLYCQVDCRLYVYAYLSEAYETDIGEVFTLRNFLQIPTLQSSLIQIPKDAQFTQIKIIATPFSPQNRVEATKMMANYGQNPPLPTIDQYQVQGQSASQHRLAIFLSLSDVKPGDKIFLSLIIAENTQIQISSSMVNNSIYKMLIGYPVYDFTANEQSRTYVINLQQYEQQNQIFDQNLQIKFICYAGFPSIIVAFDEVFSQAKMVSSYNGDYASSFYITQKIRKQKGYSGKIYINITSFWSSNFYLSAFINRKQFIDLQPHIAELIRMEQNSIKNLIFIDENIASDMDDGVIDYKIIINVGYSNNISFYVRDCGAFRNGNVLQCIVNNTDFEKEVKDQSFQLIQLQKEFMYGDFIVTFRYNVTDKCHKVGSGTMQEKYVCKYQIVLMNTNSTGEVFTTVEMVKNSVSHQLREGILQKGTVMKSEMNYYSFSLPSTQNIKALQFFVTVIQGEVSILVSKKIKYPSFDDMLKDNDMMLSFFNSVQVGEDNLKAGMYYIGVYGYAMTDFTIGVAISRVKNSEQAKNGSEIMVTEILLQKGQIQTYTMQKSTKVSKFAFTETKQKEVVLIKVNQIQGDIAYMVHDKSNLSVPKCDSRVLKVNQEDYCQFKSSINHSYVVTVMGSINDTSVFSILYTENDACDQYPWNYPIFINIAGNMTVCFSYTLYEISDVHVSLGLSPLKVLTQKVGILIKFYQRELSDITNRDRVIGSSQLKYLCGSKLDPCQFSVYITNMNSVLSGHLISFKMAIQNFNKPSVLFDGIVTKIITDKISISNSQKFYYYLLSSIYQANDFSIYVTSQTSSSYQIVAKVVNNREFVANYSQELYPKFNEMNSRTTVINTSSSSPISYFKLDKQKIQGVKTEGQTIVILISVFGIPTKSQIEGLTIYAFRIQASLGSSSLQLGSSKMGFVEKDSVFEYEVEVLQDVTSSVQIREMDSSRCAQSFIVEPISPNSPIQFTRSYLFNNETGRRNILVRTNYESCTFQVSFNSINMPITAIQESVPYQVNISQSKIKYYIYYHSKRQSFYVVQMINTGNSKIFVTSINQDNSLEDLLKKDINTFNFVSQVNTDLEIVKTHSLFCFNCFYVIAVKGSPQVLSQIAINLYGVPILLKVGSLVRDLLETGEEISYQVYSATTFNISLSIFYGNIEISVFDPNGSELFKKTASADEEMIIVTQNTYNMSLQYFDNKYRYLLKIKGQELSSYCMAIKKKQNIKIIYEDVSSIIFVKANEAYVVQFDSIQDGGTINILMEDLKYYQNAKVGKIKFTVSLENKKNVIQGIENSLSSTSVRMLAYKSKYTVQITSTTDTTLSLILSKKQFTHLVAGRTFIMSQPAIFKIFSPGDSIVIEVYVCKGDIQILASSNYSLFNQQMENMEGIVRMENANYGGHYVISADHLKGEYFVSLNQQHGDSAQLKYVISYHLYNPSLSQKMPYKIYSLSSAQVEFQYNLQSVTFMLGRVIRRDNGPIQGLETYKLYISNESQIMDQMRKCSIGNVYTSTKVIAAEQKGVVIFEFDIKQIRNIIGNSSKYFVSAQATIEIKANNTSHISQANFVYQVAQFLYSNTQMVKIMDQSQSKIQQYKTIALWVVLPFLVGSILLFYAAKYLLRSFSLYPTQLVEEDHEPQIGQTTGHIQAKSQNVVVQAK